MGYGNFVLFFFLNKNFFLSGLTLIGRDSFAGFFFLNNIFFIFSIFVFSCFYFIIFVFVIFIFLDLQRWVAIQHVLCPKDISLFKKLDERSYFIIIQFSCRKWKNSQNKWTSTKNYIFVKLYKSCAVVIRLRI